MTIKRGRVQLAEQLTKGITQLYYEDGGKEKEAIKSNANQHCWIGWMRMKEEEKGQAGNWRGGATGGIISVEQRAWPGIILLE